MKHHAGNYLRGLQAQLASWLTVDRGDRDQTVILAGAGRSGTTWVQGLINFKNDYRIMFEPFHPEQVEEARGWNRRQYIAEGDRNPRFLQPAAQILSGDIRSPWIDKYNRKTPAQKRLIKEIRAQLFLKWLHQNFPEVPIILLLRHPCAVASSRIKLGWGSLMEDFISQDALMHDFLSPFRAVMESAELVTAELASAELDTAKPSFEQHVLNWCIENYVPLCQFNPGEVCVAFYEEICMNPQQEMARIFDFIGGDDFASDMSRDLLETFVKPSAVSRKESAIVAGGNVIDAWKKQVEPAQTKRALEICSQFGLQAVYGSDSLPLISGEEALQLFSAPVEGDRFTDMSLH